MIPGAKIILNVREAPRILSPPVHKAGHHTSSVPRSASIVSGEANRPVLRQTRRTGHAFRSTAFSAAKPLHSLPPLPLFGLATHPTSRMLGYPTVFIAQMFRVNGHSHARILSALRFFLIFTLLLFASNGPEPPVFAAQQTHLH